MNRETQLLGKRDFSAFPVNNHAATLSLNFSIYTQGQHLTRIFCTYKDQLSDSILSSIIVTHQLKPPRIITGQKEALKENKKSHEGTLTFTVSAVINWPHGAVMFLKNGAETSTSE